MSGLEALLAGRVLVKRYRIEEVVGRGGFAAVYRADDLRLGRPVAVKVITLTVADAALREQLRARFQHEARAAASLPHHPNLVTVHDFGTDPELDLDFLVMELLVGEDLATHLANQGRPPLDVSLAVLHDAAEGLAVGHREGLVHRDVKPGNLFLAEPHGGEPFRLCVLDYGIARLQEEDENTRSGLTQDGNAPLSPAYASPEQLRGETHLTPASDVFSLGVVGYQLLTGEKPFQGERQRRQGEAEPVRPVRELVPDVPPAVAAVVMRALAERPEDRYADAGEMADALEGAMAGAGRRADDDETVVSPAPAVVIAAAAPEPEEDDDEATLIQAPAASIPAAAPPPPPAPRPEPRPVAAAPSLGRTSPPPPAPKRKGLPMALLGLLLLAGAAFGGWMLLGGGGSRDAGAAPATVADDTLPAAPADAPTDGEGVVPAGTGTTDPGVVTSPNDGSTPADPSGEGTTGGETPGSAGGSSPAPSPSGTVTRPAPAPSTSSGTVPAGQAPAPVTNVPRPAAQPQQQPQQRPQAQPQPQRPTVQRPVQQRPAPRPAPQRPAPQPQRPQPQPQPQPPAPQPQPQPLPPAPQPQPLPLPRPQPTPPAPLPGYPDTIIIRPTPPAPLPGTEAGSGAGPAAPVGP